MHMLQMNAAGEMHMLQMHAARVCHLKSCKEAGSKAQPFDRAQADRWLKLKLAGLSELVDVVDAAAEL